MSVDEAPVEVAILSTKGGWDEVVDFQHVIHAKVQSTQVAFPFLPFEERCDASGQFGMATKARTPVDPIPIVRAPRTHDLGMSSDRSS